MAKLKINTSPSLQRLNLVVKGLVNTKFMGNYASAFKGQGLEFADYRLYTQSDDAGLIDWKASNRSRKLLVKEFVEERNLNIYFILDVSSTMFTGSTNKLKCEYAAELVSSFVHTVLRAGDFVGLIMFSDKVAKRIMPSNGMKQYQIVSDSLSNLSFYGGDSNIGKVLDDSLKAIEENSLVVLISDFITTDKYDRAVKLAGKKFDLIGISVRDPIDMELPKGMGEVLVEDPISREAMLISPNKYRKLYAKETKKQINAVEKMFRKSGADFLPLSTDKPFIKELVSFFKRREARWR